MCWFHNSNSFSRILIDTDQSSLYFTVFRQIFLHLTHAKVHFYVWVLHVASIAWYLQRCMGSTTLLIYPIAIVSLFFLGNINDRRPQSYRNNSSCISINVELIPFVNNARRTIPTIITNIVVSLGAEGETAV